MNNMIDQYVLLFLRILYCICIIVFIDCNEAFGSVRHIILVQNSGWMLPFFEDNNSKLKDRVLDIATRIQKYEKAPPFIATFNQTCNGNISPSIIYSGKPGEDIVTSIGSIRPVMKMGGKVYTDTDFVEAISKAINQYSKGKPCVLWIITNNKNSPDNNPDTVKRNKEFYNFVNETKEISRIIAYPVPMKVKSSTHQETEYQANGLMIYVMAYGETAGAHLNSIVAKRLFFQEQPARLKPLNTEALTFIPEYVEKSQNVSVAINKRQILLGFEANEKPEEVVIHGKIANDLYPYDIVSANVSMRGHLKNKKDIKVITSCDAISDIKSGKKSQDIKVTISIPPIPSPWSPEVIFSPGYRSYGEIKFILDNQKLEVSEKFMAQMEKIFPNDPLPELFFPGKISNGSVSYQPLLIRVNYPLWPLIVVSMLFLIVASGIIFLFTSYGKEKIFIVQVGSMQKRYGLLPFKEKQIQNQHGESIGKIRRTLLTARIIKNKEFSEHNIRIL